VKLIVGLGNPGEAYAQTRHNVGFWLMDAFAKAHQIGLSGKMCEAHVGRGRLRVAGEEIAFLLAKPQTFMNRSGRSVKKLAFELGLAPTEVPTGVIVVHDDLDLPCGTIRLRARGSSGGHRGVASIIEALESDQFIRLKIGIGSDRRKLENTQETADYVLSPFPKGEREAVLNGVEKGVLALPLLLAGQLTEAMNQYHRST
jgi:PTH1 family peptidyl-tRNA hydrolase